MTTKKRADEEILGALHDLVARDLIKKIQTGEASAQELNAAIKFLKDNGIEAFISGNSAMKELADRVNSLPKFDTEDDEGSYVN